MTLWTAAGLPKPLLSEGKLLPPLDPDLEAASLDTRQYLYSLPSGPYLSNAGYHTWTDGSVRTGCKTAGAGAWYQPAANLPAILPIC